MNSDRGSWFTLFSGRKFYPLDPRPDEIYVRDIAHALSLLCRFNGHCARHYSVAQHSVYCSNQVPDEHKLAALLHDATEAYVGDMIRPLKKNIPQYVEIENKVWTAIASRFSLSTTLPECVHVADNTVLAAEAQALLLPLGERKSWLPWEPPANLRVETWTSEEASAMFLDRFQQLYRGSDKSTLIG